MLRSPAAAVAILAVVAALARSSFNIIIHSMSSLYTLSKAASTQFRRIQFFSVSNHIHEPVQTAVVSARRTLGLEVVLGIENLFGERFGLWRETSISRDGRFRC